MIYKKSWKYILTDIIESDKLSLTVTRKFYRLKALRDFKDVKKGDLGGYIYGYYNLSQSGDCWVYDSAWVFDDAQVSENAIISNYAYILDNAKVSGNAQVCDYAQVFGHARVSGNVTVSGYARISGEVHVGDDGEITGNIFLK